MTTQSSKEIAVFGTGCFWCTEALFARLNGVISVKPGYTGGTLKDPSYHEVCEGNTGHAEVIQIEFDPAVITFEELLDVFWHVHDPTSLNRQGNDIGTQYRSAIFYTNISQKEKAELSKQQLDKSNEFGAPIVTEVTPLDIFYEAESYHHDYYTKNDYQPYCQIVIAPKIQKFLQKYSEKIKNN